MEKRKYICSCGQEYTTSEGLAAHLKKSGCPKDLVRVVAVGSGEVKPLKKGRPSSGEMPTVTVGVPRIKAQEVKLEGGPISEVEELEGEKEKKKGPPVVSPFLVSLFQMVPMTATIYNTPPLWTSYAVAKIRGFRGGLDEFISVTAMQFWLDRGINPFEELTVIFQEVPSSLEEKLSLAMGGAHEPGNTGVVENPAEGEEGEPE